MFKAWVFGSLVFWSQAFGLRDLLVECFGELIESGAVGLKIATGLTPGSLRSGFLASCLLDIRRLDSCLSNSYRLAPAALGPQAFGSWVFGSRVFGPRAFETRVSRSQVCGWAGVFR